MIMGMKNPRIWSPPTQFQKLSKNFKIKFPGNWTKTLISPESARLTEVVPTFWKENNAHTKKIFRFLIPEFSLYIEKLRADWLIIANGTAYEDNIKVLDLMIVGLSKNEPVFEPAGRPIQDPFLRIPPLYAFWRKYGQKWFFGHSVVHGTTFEHFRSLWRHLKKNRKIINFAIFCFWVISS